MLSPEQIRKRALNRYEDFLRSLARGENGFPMAVFGSGMSRVTDYEKAREAIAKVHAQSKEKRGCGYSVEWKLQGFRRFGDQRIPAGISFLTREDFTRFLGKCAEVERFEKNCKLINATFPELTAWTQEKPLKVVEYSTEWESLLKVCRHLRACGRPNCYLRELPVEVDTKFIERNRGVLGELLPIVAPGCVGLDASTFETRFGFRQKQPLIRFRLLDPEIATNARLPFADFAIPVDEADKLRVEARNVIIVENEMTFLTLPRLPSTVALLGAGDAVSLLCRLSWLSNVRLVYWGDMDTHGFASLSVLRSQYPHSESVMMDSETFDRFKQFAVKASAYISRAELNLNSSEQTLFDRLALDGLLLEQERILLSYAIQTLQARLR